MSLEAGDGYFSGLVATNPVGAVDPKSQGDDHIRLIKTAAKGTFPNLTGAVTASQAELNILDGATLSTAELNILDGATLSTAELNILDGVTLTASQINDAARKSANNTFSGTNAFNGGGIDLGSTADQATLRFINVAGAESGDQGYLDFGAGSTSQLRLFGFDASASAFRSALVFNVANGTLALGDGTNSITLNGVASTDFARLSQSNTFTGVTQTVSGSSNTQWRLTDGTITGGTLLVPSSSICVFGTQTAHAAGILTNNNTRLEVSAAGNFDFKSGTVLAAQIANSTSTTLVAGQLHFIDGDATLPNLTAGQWIQVVNDGSSARTISKNGSDTTYWALTGATVSTSFTLAARGVLTARCSPAGNVVYVTGSGITSAT